MFNPLAPDPTKLTDTELHEKITKLLQRMSFFARTGHTASYQQANELYQGLLFEQQERVFRQMNSDKGGDDDQFGDLIDVKKL